MTNRPRPARAAPSVDGQTMRRLVGGVAVAAVLLAGCRTTATDGPVTAPPDHPDAVCRPVGPRPGNGANCFLGEPGANPERGGTTRGDDSVTILVIPPGTATVTCPPGLVPPGDVCVVNQAGDPVRAVFGPGVTPPPADIATSPLCPPAYPAGFRCYVEPDGRVVVVATGG
jgi:hypothetical protein